MEDIRASSSNEMTRAYSSITNQIAREFEAPRIQVTMEKVVIQEAQQRIDAVADRMIEQKLSALVKPQIAEINETLITAKAETHTLSDSLDGLRKTLTVVTDEQEFLSLANAARLYSLSAFLELDRLSQTTNAFAKDAKQIVWALRRDMEIDRQSLTEYVPIELFDEKYTYNGPFTSEEIASRLRIPQGVEGGANIARKEGLKYFIPQLVTMAQSENNLWVENRITHAISVLSGKEFFPWTLDSLKTWWEGSAAQFTNWPYASFDKALIRFNARQYFGARLEFESIINSDPYADQSRALAIVCAIETGDTNKIATLATNWKYPDGRWAGFAKAKMNLSTGDVTQATIQLAEFTAKYRTLENRIAIRPDVPYLRQVDWPLYKQKLAELLEQNK